MAEIDPRVKLFDNCLQSAVKEWGGYAVFFSLGEKIQRALVAEKLLVLLAAQDESISNDTVRGLLDSLYSLLTDRMPATA